MAGTGEIMQTDETPPAIQIENVSKYFGDFQALDQVSMEVDAGERVVVCGPSGSGKSTLIRCINQLEKYESGKITVDGVELRRDKASLKSSHATAAAPG